MSENRARGGRNGCSMLLHLSLALSAALTSRRAHVSATRPTRIAQAVATLLQIIRRRGPRRAASDRTPSCPGRGAAGAPPLVAREWRSGQCAAAAPTPPMIAAPPRPPASRGGLAAAPAPPGERRAGGPAPDAASTRYSSAIQPAPAPAAARRLLYPSQRRPAVSARTDCHRPLTSQGSDARQTELTTTQIA